MKIVMKNSIFAKLSLIADEFKCLIRWANEAKNLCCPVVLLKTSIIVRLDMYFEELLAYKTTYITVLMKMILKASDLCSHNFSSDGDGGDVIMECLYKIIVIFKLMSVTIIKQTDFVNLTKYTCLQTA